MGMIAWRVKGRVNLIKGGISEMPSQAVTLEPEVQGERTVAILRLLDKRACSPIAEQYILFVLNIGSGDWPAGKHLREIFYSLPNR